ncbi:TetR/AcrR family transcriptional regulator [Streptomyces niveiscabiei]|uniref:TetR/AcrR family transcriptional regulator n=1 Tax=Streptomyces niveiscabiei TaxID=164115 RepID=UPI0029A6CFB6|nr:TetR/AcrR family transcriptional regulator [Streptomyces niveiscabiei]MDX3383887.1 TetR/AcrR family transcriptional regulator [Streptomyces niveiscabiei]
MPTTSPPAARPGRPRDPGADERILQAAVDELAETGVAGFRTNSVAARAKVAKRTLYSRWPERDDLVLAALSSLSGCIHPPRTGSLEQDLGILYDKMAETLESPQWLIVYRCSFEFPDFPELYATFLRDCVDQPLAVMEDVLYDAERRGELRPGLDRSVAAESFAAALTNFSSHISHQRGVSAAGTRDRFLDLFLNGVRSAES